MKRVDVTNRKNIKCEHCNNWNKDTEICGAKHERTNYYNQCKSFAWREQIKKSNEEMTILPGQQFGRLTTLNLCGKDNYGHEIWACRCVCGKCVEATNSNLLAGNTKSCGCLEKENRETVNITHGDSRNSKLYKVWHSMICRCELKNDNAYKYYGARGIRVCSEWHDYSIFKQWAFDNGYVEMLGRNILTIDRINNDGNYEPSNCRWVDMKTQANNRRNSYGKRKENT